jgi:hypothetical protein
MIFRPIRTGCRPRWDVLVLQKMSISNNTHAQAGHIQCNGILCETQYGAALGTLMGWYHVVETIRICSITM